MTINKVLILYNNRNIVFDNEISMSLNAWSYLLDGNEIFVKYFNDNIDLLVIPFIFWDKYMSLCFSLQAMTQLQ